jgi:hypothetical protein
MSLLDRINYIRQLNDDQINNLPKDEVKKIVKVVQRYFEDLRKLNHNKKLISAYEKRLDNFNPNFFPIDKLLDESWNSYTIKQFIQAQNAKILYQDLKIKQLQSVKPRKSKRTRTCPNTDRLCLSDNKKFSDMCVKISELLQRKSNRIETNQAYYIESYFYHSEEDLKSTSKAYSKESKLKFKTLYKKYGENIFKFLINKRKAWDIEYKNSYELNKKQVKKNFESIKSYEEVTRNLLDPIETMRFIEGKEIFNFYSKKNVIVPDTPYRHCGYDDTQEYVAEILIKWDSP